MIWFIDTEFMDHGDRVDLISIGLVREDGKEFYAVSEEFDPNTCSDWVKQNVLAHLGGVPVPDTRRHIRNAIFDLIKEDAEPPTFWGYYADYDWVLFCQLFGGMLNLPKNWPQLCLDLKQEMIRLGLGKQNVPLQDPSTAHNALEDAKWNRDVYIYMLR